MNLSKLTPNERFNAFVDAKAEQWTAIARQTMLNSGEDAVVALFREIYEEMANPCLPDNDRFKLQLAVVGFARVFLSAFCVNENPVVSDTAEESKKP